MVYTIAIIGSFQKYYSDILNIIKTFKQAGLCVLSPKESYIDGKIDDFVIFGSDRKDYSPAEIQMITLERIIEADVVYVYNPDGYVGKTTCYEIGFCLAKRKPLYFFEYPEDLPIAVVKEKQVLKPEVFVNNVCHREIKFIEDYQLCAEAQKSFYKLLGINASDHTPKVSRIVICGSMMFYDDMLRCKYELQKMGIESIVPKEENDSVSLYNEAQYIEFKRKVSRAYLKRIRDKETIGVLIYNAEKRGVQNYIGANTLVELAMAFTWNRKIFLLNDMYPPLKDELLAWDCICLNGDLSKIRNEINKPDVVVQSPYYQQLTFGDI